MSEEVQLSIQGEIALLHLCRPSHGNALRGQMFDSLRKAALSLADRPPQFVVITAEGADFCRGLALDSTDPLVPLLAPMVANRDAYRVQELITRLRGCFDTLSRLPCPVIVAVEGQCHGAGLELALMADLRIASDEATFAMSDIHRGLLTGLGGIVLLSVLLGPARAQHLALTGEVLDAAQAQRLGLVSQLCPPGSARATALDLVANMRRTSAAARLQILLATRAVRSKMIGDMMLQESQCAARTWIAGDWQRTGQAKQ